jgi:long-chain acyl-CoA synthetase
MNFTAISLHGGHTIVLIDKWTAEGTLERIEKYRVTHSHMVPTSATISRPTATTA